MRIFMTTLALAFFALTTAAQAANDRAVYRFCMGPSSEQGIFYFSGVFDVSASLSPQEIEQDFKDYTNAVYKTSLDYADCNLWRDTHKKSLVDAAEQREIVEPAWTVKTFLWPYSEKRPGAATYAFCVSEIGYEEERQAYYSPIFEKSFDASIPAMEASFQGYLDDEYGMKDYRTTCQKADSMARVETLMDISAIKHVSWPSTTTNWRYEGTVSTAEKPDRPSSADGAQARDKIFEMIDEAVYATLVQASDGVFHIAPQKGKHKWVHQTKGCAEKKAQCYYVYRGEYLALDTPVENGDVGPYKYSLWYGLGSEGKFDLAINVALPGITITSDNLAKWQKIGAAMRGVLNTGGLPLFGNLRSVGACEPFVDKNWPHGGMACSFGKNSMKALSLFYDYRIWSDHRTEIPILGPTYTETFPAVFFEMRQFTQGKQGKVILDVPISVGVFNGTWMAETMDNLFGKTWDPARSNLPSRKRGLIGPVRIQYTSKLSLMCLTSTMPKRFDHGGIAYSNKCDLDEPNGSPLDQAWFFRACPEGAADGFCKPRIISQLTGKCLGRIGNWSDENYSGAPEISECTAGFEHDWQVIQHVTERGDESFVLYHPKDDKCLQWGMSATSITGNYFELDSNSSPCDKGGYSYKQLFTIE